MSGYITPTNSSSAYGGQQVDDKFRADQEDYYNRLANHQGDQSWTSALQPYLQGEQQANDTMGVAQNYAQQGSNDASYQRSGMDALSSLASGSSPSAAEQASSQALNNGIQNQRTAAASAPGGSIAQAMGLRNVSQGEAGQQAQGALANQALRANEMNSAAARYGQAAQAYGASNTNQMNAQTGLASIYGQDAINSANLQAQRRSSDQQNNLFNQGMAYNTNAASMAAGQKTADLAEQERENRRVAKQNDNSNMAKAVGGVVGGLSGALSVLSDERAKNKLSEALAYQHNDPPSVAALYAPEGKELHQSYGGHAYLEDAPITAKPRVPQASLVSDGVSRETEAPAKPKDRKAALSRQATRQMTPDEMLAAADREIASVNADSARRQAEGPAVQPAIARANYEAPMYDDELSYGQPSMSYGRRTGGFAYGGRHG